MGNKLMRINAEEDTATVNEKEKSAQDDDGNETQVLERNICLILFGPLNTLFFAFLCIELFTQ